MITTARLRAAACTWCRAGRSSRSFPAAPRRSWPTAGVRPARPSAAAAAKSEPAPRRGTAFVPPTGKKNQNAEVSYTAGINQSGTLTVTDGVHTANIALLGAYIAGNFTAASDGHGGTLITYTSASTTGGHGHAIASPVTS